MVEELNKIPGTKFHTPDGAFYMMVTLPVDDVEKLQYFLLEEFEDNGDTVMYAPAAASMPIPPMAAAKPDRLCPQLRLFAPGHSAFGQGHCRL